MRFFPALLMFLTVVAATLAGPAMAQHLGAGASARSRCEALIGRVVPNGRVVGARWTAAGYQESPETAAYGVAGFTLPEACRLSVVLRPTSDSDINVEVWLPTQTWNGRLQGVGNGGFSGSINRQAMTVDLKYNYAVAATDTGHRSSDTDAAWMIGHPQKVIDCTWRAIHETAVAAKTLIQDFYGRPAHYAYFSGGSNGGRQALIEAERFPADYDGVAAGAPALDGANNLSTGAWIEHQLIARPSGFIPASKGPMIAAAVLKACDGLDGVVDGLIENPLVCHFDPKTLLCAGADAPDCLTGPQAVWLKNIYDGPGGSYRGHRNWGYARGGEGGWTPFWLGTSPKDTAGPVFSTTFFRDLVYGDPGWTLDRFSYSRDRAAAVERTAWAQFEAVSPDLARFKARGGKLILYQGWADPLVPPRITIDYFKRVQRRMGVKRAATFVRLYMAPGVTHVTGGPGPNVFGQIAPGGASDPNHSVNAALEQWVEKGIAPNVIIAGKYANDRKPLIEPGSLKPVRERPLCPYPQVARWDAKGSIDEAASFACVLESSTPGA